MIVQQLFCDGDDIAGHGAALALDSADVYFMGAGITPPNNLLNNAIPLLGAKADSLAALVDRQHPWISIRGRWRDQTTPSNSTTSRYVHRDGPMERRAEKNSVARIDGRRVVLGEDRVRVW